MRLFQKQRTNPHFKKLPTNNEEHNVATGPAKIIKRDILVEK